MDDTRKKWEAIYNNIRDYIERNHGHLSKYDFKIRHLYTWVKHNQKMINQGGMKQERVGLFNKLLDLAEEYKRASQWV